MFKFNPFCTVQDMARTGIYLVKNGYGEVLYYVHVRDRIVVLVHCSFTHCYLSTINQVPFKDVFGSFFYFRYIVLYLHMLQEMYCRIQQASKNSMSPCSVFFSEK